ncbi:voltage-gated potassium channel [Lecanosticta acicola]|uniref:Voltage-gated potassium channel n=1 Tax=Lecanosticta acicola TaxID=111012 RepID=A0AAI8Z466_9PEZI|nr:voltage-gated potassium channel [Lecanosticta acicola]
MAADDTTANAGHGKDGYENGDWQSGPLGIQHRDPHDFFHHHPRRSSRRPSSSRRRSSIVLLPRQTTDVYAGGRHFGRFHLREWDDDDEQDWWFASTAIPLLAATIGPLANVLSIAALVTSWRMCLVSDVSSSAEAKACDWNGDTNALAPQLMGHDFADPRWCYWLNVVSLIVGFIGNFFLLCNFTNRIRYIIALPVTILCWYLATGILIGIMASMQIYVPPMRPQQTYTQGFWYAVIAACMYMICAMLLMVNMLGYFLGHYPQHFTLTESQRTLILQTMLFFVWLAGGAAVFSRVEQTYGDGQEGWAYVDALYFCDVTILTVGFGDLAPTSNVGRGIVFPYSVGGIIMLGLMVSSIAKFALELGSEKIVRRHVERSRARTVGRTVTSSMELEERHRKAVLSGGERPVISAPFDPVDRSKKRIIGFTDDADVANRPDTRRRTTGPVNTLQMVGSMVLHPQRRAGSRKPKLILLKEERDRFNAMRNIQNNTRRFKNWYALCLSVTAFGILWAVGAVVFWQCEKNTQGMTYFQALYLCYVSLLTIGYGDLAPKSNAGRPFFVSWSLIAVPTMTILVGDLGETVINKFKSGTSRLSDFTVLPQKGAYRQFLNQFPSLVGYLQQRKDRKEHEKRLESGFPLGPDPDEGNEPPTIDELAQEEPSYQDLARKLTKVIRRTANDVKDNAKKKYSYEEWVEFTQLIRFTAKDGGKADGEDEEEEEGEGMVEWDWIGEDSPMMAGIGEAEFVLERLCESMSRFVRRAERAMGDDGGDAAKKRRESEDLGPRGEKMAQSDGGDPLSIIRLRIAGLKKKK